MSRDIKTYEIGPTIGKGSYATVKLAVDTLSNKQVAIKIYDKKKLLDPHKLKNVKREISILSKVVHPNIVRLYTVIDASEQVREI